MAHKGEKANGSHYTSTRRSRKQPQKIAKPKKKISKRAALIKKAEKSGVKLRTDWSALYPNPPAKKKPVSKIRFTEKEKKWIKRIGELNKQKLRKMRRNQTPKS